MKLKMKKEYVIPYVKSFIAFVIMLGIVLISCCFIKEKYENERVETIKTDMLLVEAKIKMIEEEVNMKKKGVSYVGTKASDMEEDEEIKKLVEGEIIDLKSKKHNYYVLNQENLQELELTEVELTNGYYVVDYATEEVILTSGICDKEGNMIYKLSDIKEMSDDKKIDKTEIKEENKEKNKEEK